MKQQTLLFLLIILPVMASAYDAKIGGIYYNFNNTAKTAEVTHNESSNPYSDNVSIPNEVTYQGVKYSVTSIGNYAFSECEGLTSVFISNNVTSIGKHAFYNCKALTSVTIGNSVKYIGDGAFYFCWKLTSVTIPNSVITIGSGAFMECRGLASITIGNGVQSIGDDAFACGSSVYISDLSAWCKINFSNALSNPLFNGHKLFLNGSEVKSLVIPNDVTIIRNYTFSCCHSITSVTIPNCVTKIGNYAFDHCSLTSLTIPNSVTSIGEKAFSYCPLKTIHIGESINRIGYYAFGYCPQLTDVTCKATTVPTTDANTFQNSNIENALLYVSESVLDRYQAAVPWNSFMEISAIPSFTLTYIIDGTVYKTYILEEGDIIIPEPTPSKGDFTFSGWSEIPETMPAHDVTVTGSFIINKYKLIYKVDDADYKSYELEYGAMITLEPEPTKKGYTFSGWSEIPETMPAHDVTVTGSFTKITQEKCAMPTIALRGGKLIFECETPDVEFNYNITANGSKSGKGNYLSVTPSFTVRVYASKEGMEDSETAAQVIYYKNGDANGDGQITVTDIGVIVDIILGNTPAGSRKMQQEVEPQ